MAAYTFSTLMCAGIASGVSRNSGDWLSTHPSGHANRQAVKTVMFLRTKAAEREKRLLQRLLLHTNATFHKQHRLLHLPSRD